MEEQKLQEIIAVLKAINDDWSLVERGSIKDFMVLIDSNRDEKEGLRPRKDLIEEMETLGYIRKFEYSYNSGNILQKSGEEGSEWKEIPDSFSILHFYEVTSKGYDLLESIR